MANNKYCEYFDIDEEYLPQINDSSIKGNPNLWKKTFPHETFIEILKAAERVLARQEKRSLWIEGAYGTGKSQCAYALKKILEVPEDELRAYWNRYEPLRGQSDLLEKLVGHKRKGIVTAYRYASGMINSPRDLFVAVQDSVKMALEAADLYAGENSLKESVIAWIEEPTHKAFFDTLLKKPEWASLFSQSSADEVLLALRKGGEVKTLMDNIFSLADKEGITALNIDADRLIDWLTDVINQNKVKIVLIWDEFSDYFKRNRESLTEFQRLAELVNLVPFYFIVVTHESGQLFTSGDTTWSKVSDRFIPIHISLPDNIAFELIGHAFTVKPAAQAAWDTLVDGDLGSQTSTSRAKVMSTANIRNERVMKEIMPLHPMAALILKNIASAFKSNQRSMFDFIKTLNTDDVKAFQWFIENTGPFDDHPLLTVDMLWNFFYENGKDNLTPDIRLILDTYPQQQNLRDDERAVLKAILIMQAIDQRLGGQIDLFKATDQNLSYVFEGIPDLEGTKSASLAKGLKEKGILVANPIDGGRYVYAAAVLAGDQVKIDKFKKEVRENSTTAKLVSEGDLATVLALSPPLRLRYESEPATGKITPVTTSDFTRTINTIRERDVVWHFNAVIAFAKDDAEAAAFRKTLKAAAADEQYRNIVFIDALSTPLGSDGFDQYVDYTAMAMYYQGGNNTSSNESADKAKRVLDQDWKNRIYSGQFIVYTYTNQEGEKLGNAQGVASVLQTIVTKRFPNVFDFAKGISESQMKMTSMKQSARAGIIQATSGVVVDLEKHILPTVWKSERYWENPATSSLHISIIKTEVDKRIEEAFSQNGQISIDEIYGLLEHTYGFAPCNLSAFVTGFLLKEYGSEPYRYSDSSGEHELMTQDKLAEMISNCIGKTPKPTYILKMTADEMAFFELTESAWGIQPNSCSSAGQAAMLVSEKMRKLGLPVWCLEEVDNEGVFDVIQMYIDLVMEEGKAAHNKAIDIGRIATAQPSLDNSLRDLLTVENCQKGMREFLSRFENGALSNLASEIGSESVLSDVRDRFTVEHSCLWDKQIGEDEIRKLIVEYSIVKQSNVILDVNAHSLNEIYKVWRERLRFIGISCEALQAKYPELLKTLDALKKISQHADMIPEQQKAFLSELVEHTAGVKQLFSDSVDVFHEVYKPYLEDLSESDIAEIRSKLQTDLFGLSKSECNSKVKEASEELRKNQLKSQLLRLWGDKTDTKNPRAWSSQYRTPILCCVSEDEFERARKAFDAFDRSVKADADIIDALDYFTVTSLFDVLGDKEKRDGAFKRVIVGQYSALLPDMERVRDALERLTIEVYEWYEHPGVKRKIVQLAEAEYNAGGSDKALQKIDEMGEDVTRLKQYLRRLVMDNMKVGIEILMDEE